MALERLERLKAHHVRTMSPGRCLVIAARCSGLKPKEIARALHRSEGAVRNDLTLAYATVLDAAGVRRDVCLLTWWAIQHGSCCLREAFASLEALGLARE